MAEKPAATFIARAVPWREGWRAEFALPGLYVDYVRSDDGEPREFENRATAEFIAMRTAVNAANARPRWTWRNIHKRMSGDEFAVRLAETGLSPTDFAVMWGTRHDRVMDWITGAQDVPFPLVWILELLADPEAAERALEIATANTRRRDET